MDTDLTKVQRGKRARRSGREFENQVRRDLEAKNYIVCKWTNTVDITEDKIIPAKSKFNPYTRRVMSEGSGLPDFVAFRKVILKTPSGEPLTFFNVVGIEAKKAKYLDKKERRICKWYLEHETFSKMYVAYPLKNKPSDKRKKGIAYYKLEKDKLK
jgi:hypothetical protein